jgi:hypothetical protein
MTDMAALLEAKKRREVSLNVSIDDEGTTAPFLFRALKRTEYRALLDDHPASEEGADWNTDTFAPALIAASAVDPVITIEQATQMWDEWEAGEMGRMFLACWQLNEQLAGVGFMSPGSVKTSGSGQRSSTATKKGSRTRRS